MDERFLRDPTLSGTSGQVIGLALVAEVREHDVNSMGEEGDMHE